MDDSDDISQAEPSSLRRLNNQKNHHKLFTFQINSLNDREFITALKNPVQGSHARTTLPNVAIREDNIRSRRENGRAIVNGKEISLVLKSGHHETIVDFLHSVDDNTFRTLATNDRAMKVIMSDHALFKRYSTIEKFTPESIKKRRTSLSPRYDPGEIPVFSLDREV